MWPSVRFCTRLLLAESESDTSGVVPVREVAANASGRCTLRSSEMANAPRAPPQQPTASAHAAPRPSPATVAARARADAGRVPFFANAAQPEIGACSPANGSETRGLTLAALQCGQTRRICTISRNSRSGSRTSCALSWVRNACFEPRAEHSLDSICTARRHAMAAEVGKGAAAGEPARLLRLDNDVGCGCHVLRLR